MPQVWIGVIGALTMAGALAGIYYLVVRQNAVIGTKAIQFLAVSLTLLLMLILGIMNIIGRETIGVVVGVIIGFALASPWKD